MKLKLSIFLTLLLLINSTIVPCTNFIVTKSASNDGSTFLSYTADSYTFYGELYHFPAALYPEGAMLDIYEWDTGKWLGRIPQARRTYNVVGNMNEFQVSIGETTFGGRSELVNPKGLIDYGSLIYIALQRSTTAREAIKVMTELVNEHGYYSSGESFSIVDANEAWILELIGKGPNVKGAVWVAHRIPDGYVSGHANQARITTFALNDKENVLYAPDVITFAREKGYFSGKDADFDFSAAYNPLDFGGIRFCDGRVWSLFRRVNPSMDKYITYIKGESTERMPLYVKPENKLAVSDVMHLMRDHYQGTDLDMTKGIAAGPYHMPVRWRPLTWEHNGETYFHERPISTPQTGFSFVSQARASMPREVGGVLWFGVDDTYMTVYSPIYSSSTQVPHNFAKGVGSFTNFTWDSAFWVFNFVSNYAYPKFSLVIDDVQREQRRLEGKFLSAQENIESTALALHKESKGKSIDFLTNYSVSAATETYTSWKKLGEYLIYKYMDGTVKDEFGKIKSPGYSPEFRAEIVKESGDKLKLLKLPGEIDNEVFELAQKAKTQVEQKDYVGAKKSYEAILKLKPEHAEALAKKGQLEEMLKQMEVLHNTLLK